MKHLPGAGPRGKNLIISFNLNPSSPQDASNVTNERIGVRVRAIQRVDKNNPRTRLL